MNTFIFLYDYLKLLGIANSFDAEFNIIECYATSEYMLALVRGLNFNSDGLTYHIELIKSCTWLLTRS
jgi:hypothetical protein